MESQLERIGCNSGRKLISVLAALTAIFAALWLGCGDGCGCGDEQVPQELQREVAEELGDQVVAVARFSNFDKRHFDVQHWWAEAVQQGYLTGRDDGRGGIAPKPTRQLRQRIEAVLSEMASGLDWSDGFDVSVWRPEAADEPWRWALSFSVVDQELLAGRFRWDNQGYFRIGHGSDAEQVPVFERDIDGDFEGTYYVAAIDGPSALGERQVVTISNFEAGAARITEAVEMADMTGEMPAELRLWPRRLGIAERHRRFAELMEHGTAIHGQQLASARLGILQRRTHLQRALANRQAWPETIRLAMDIERDEETGGAQIVELMVDVPVDDQILLEALSDALDGGEGESGPAATGFVGQLQLDLDSTNAPALVSAAIPASWVEVLSVRGAEERRELSQSFEDLSAQLGGPMTVAFYDSPLPMGMSAEVFVGWEIAEGADPGSAARRFHSRLLGDHWMHLHEHPKTVDSEQREEKLGGVDVVLDKKTFVVGHGHGDVGVCSTVRDREFLSYYGVRPCERLLEVFDESERTKADSSLRYSGDFTQMIETFYSKPMDLSSSPFGDYEIDIEVDGERRTDGAIRLTAQTSDHIALAKMVDGLPTLREGWDYGDFLGVDEPAFELPLNAPAYQEPGLMVLGAPGMGGILPPSLLLGMPFSYPPMMPREYRQLYFGGPDLGGGHSH